MVAMPEPKPFSVHVDSKGRITLPAKLGRHQNGDAGAHPRGHPGLPGGYSERRLAPADALEAEPGLVEVAVP